MRYVVKTNDTEARRFYIIVDTVTRKKVIRYPSRDIATYECSELNRSI